MKHLVEIIQTKDIKLKTAVQILENSLIAFSSITNVPITYFSIEGKVLWEFNKENKFCIANMEYYDQESNCMVNLKAAMKTAYSLGEVYIFVCNTGLINMCYAFVFENELIGYFNAGPIAMGKNKERTIMQFYEKVPQEKIDLPRLMSVTNDLKVLTPKDITYLSTLYVNALSSPFVSIEEKSSNRQRYIEQSRIGTKIIEMKKSSLQIEYPVVHEQNLINCIKSGDFDTSRKLFSEYLGELMVFEGGNISVIKLRLLTLISKLIDPVNDLEKDYRNIAQMEAINNASTFAEINTNAASIIQLITKDTAEKHYSGNSAIISQTVDYLHQHFSEDINLNKTAEAIHVNNTYLSTLFKKEMGISIVDYIRDLRLEHAAEMIVNTNISITEISLACGFKEISYFTKLFKNKYNETPRKYRNSHKD